MKYAWIAEQGKSFVLSEMCDVLDVSVSGYIPRQDHDYAFGVGLRMLTLRRIVLEEDGLFRPAPGEIETLAYYANAIAHLDDSGQSVGPT